MRMYRCDRCGELVSSSCRSFIRKLVSNQRGAAGRLRDDVADYVLPDVRGAAGRRLGR